MLKPSARGTDSPWYKGWDLSERERAAFRATTLASQEAKRRALRGESEPKHPVNSPRLDPVLLMPPMRRNGLRSLSLFSGGGGLDIGFDRAGFVHVASFEIMTKAAEIIRAARPGWHVFGGVEGDVTLVDWSAYRGRVDVLHGGPPCQPFSHAGRRNGAADVRDMIPEFVRAVRQISPPAFVLENVSGLLTKRFESYVRRAILEPLETAYSIASFDLDAADFGVPQRRRRVFFIGFRTQRTAVRFRPPAATHAFMSAADASSGLVRTMGAREALGLPSIGVDGLAPTIRSGLTGPRHTTSILNSVTALRVWTELQIWPNGVAPTRERASAYPAKNGHFRLSLADCMVLQGFPADWPVGEPVYFSLGLIGNSVAPPMAYRLARAVAGALS
jgi:DNA (cytosine-5)-methyltransferase 1